MAGRAVCQNGGWVIGTHIAFPMDAGIYKATRDQRIPCNQLFCERCHTPVKHMDGVKIAAAQPRNLGELYDSLDPDAWIDLVELHGEYRLYFCRCHWHSTSGEMAVGDLDKYNIDEWACAGHPTTG